MTPWPGGWIRSCARHCWRVATRWSSISRLSPIRTATRARSSTRPIPFHPVRRSSHERRRPRSDQPSDQRRADGVVLVPADVGVLCPPGVQRLRPQSQEEYGHAMKLYDFLIARDGAVELGAMPAPKQSFETIAAVFEAALAQEQDVSRQIDALYELAFR